MEEKIEEKNDKLFTIIVIILVIILLGGIGYLVFDRVIQKDKYENKIDLNNDESKVKNIDKYKSTIITIPSEACLVQKEKVDCNKKHAYFNKKITLDDINDADKIYTVIALKDLSKDDETVSISDVTEALVSVYGEDSVVKDYEISFQDDYTSFSLDGNKYVIAGGEAPEINENEVDEMFITKVTKDSEYLYVYNKNIAYTLKNTEPGTTDGEIIIFKDFSKKKQVAKINYKEISDEWLSEYELKKLLMKDYKQYVINFKHTFKQSNDDNYYYNSTEPVKK